MEREKERVRDEHSYMYIHTGYKSWLPGEGRPTSVLIIISSLCNEDDLNQIYMYNKLYIYLSHNNDNLSAGHSSLAVY